MKLKTTKPQIVMEVIGGLIIIGMFLFVLLQWGDIPQKIPEHYDFTGQVDKWGDKTGVLIMPIMAVALYLLLTVVTMFPRIWNVPVEITESNKEAVYSCMKSMLIFMKIEILATFSYITYCQVTSTKLSSLFLTVVLLGLFATIAFFIIKTIKVAKANSDVL